MSDRRRANVAWMISNDGGVIHDRIKGGVLLAVMLDIRDELQTLNRLLGCANFTGIPRTLRAIETNTKKKPRAKKVTA